MAAGEQALARKDALLNQLSTTVPTSAALAAGSRVPPPSSVALNRTNLLTEQKDSEQRHARKLALAEESVRSLQAQLRRKDAEFTRQGAQLAQVRDAARRDKALAVADAERLTDRLDLTSEQFVQRGLEALEKLKSESEPKPAGSAVTVHQLEESLEDKDRVISELQAELEATHHELQASRQCVQERMLELTGARELLESQQRREPSIRTVQRVGVLNGQVKEQTCPRPRPQPAWVEIAFLTRPSKCQVKAKERELTKMREALTTLKAEMDFLSKDHAERFTRVSERAARAEAKAANDAGFRERMVRLQERLQGLASEVRMAKQREDAAKRAAAEADAAASTAQGLASRTAAELVRLQSEVTDLRGKLEQAPRREAALKRQLDARTDQLEALECARGTAGAGRGGASVVSGAGVSGVTSPPEPVSATGDAAATVAEAVAVAVAAERRRWEAVSVAVGEVQEARNLDSEQSNAHQVAQPTTLSLLRETQRERDSALSDAKRLRAALKQAEAQVGALRTDKPLSLAPPSGNRRKETAASEIGVGVTGGDTGAIASASASFLPPVTASSAHSCTPRTEGPLSCTGGGVAAATAVSAAAVERWEAEKRLQKKHEALRTRLHEKMREIGATEAEVARGRLALEESARREAALREGLVSVQEQLGRAGRERESAVASALAEMRTREELSNKLYETQLALSKASNELRKQRAVPSTSPTAVSSGADFGNGTGGAVAEIDKLPLRTALLEKEQALLEQRFALEEHERTISQLQARLRDQGAYNSVLSKLSSGTTEFGQATGEVFAASRISLERPRLASIRVSSRSSAPGREELATVVEKMQRVVSNLQEENAALRKRSVSNIKYVEVCKENNELKASCKYLRQQLSEEGARLSVAVAEAETAGRLTRELAEARRALRVETTRSTHLRTKLADAQQAKSETEAKTVLVTASAEDPSSPRVQQLELVNKKLEATLRAAQRAEASLRDETSTKGRMLVEMGAQLSDALRQLSDADTLAAEATLRTRELQAVCALLVEAEADRDRLAAALEHERQIAAVSLTRRGARVGEDGLGAEALAVAVSSAVGPLSEENAALRAENSTMAAELAGLSPQFFDEVEDLKYAYAQAREQVERYVNVHGPLAGGVADCAES